MIICTPGMPAPTFEESLQWLKKNDFGMEIEFVRQVYMTPIKAKEYGELNKSYDIFLTIHAPYFINLGNPEKQSQSMKYILDSADRAEKLGANVVVFHPGYYLKDKEKAKKEIIDRCKELVKKTNVLLGLETTGRQSQFGTIEETAELCRKIEGCVPVVDFAHIYARNNGNINYDYVFKQLDGFKNLHSHISGIEYSKGNEKNHLPIRSNQPPLKEYIEQMKKHKDIIQSVTCESPLAGDDCIRLKNMFAGHDPDKGVAEADARKIKGEKPQQTKLI